MSYNRLIALAAAILPPNVANLVLPSSSISAPFEAGTKGKVLESKLQVDFVAPYAFYLVLFFDRNNFEHVRALAGSGTRDKFGQLVDNGIAIPVKLTVGPLYENHTRSIVDGQFTKHRLVRSTTDHFTKSIRTVRLDPGLYRIRVEALQDIPQLKDVTIRFDTRIWAPK